MNRIGVIGAGAWGTALAAVASRAGREVVLQAREADVVASINETHVNARFLPDVALDAAITATASAPNWPMPGRPAPRRSSAPRVSSKRAAP